MRSGQVFAPGAQGFTFFERKRTPDARSLKPKPDARCLKPAFPALDSSLMAAQPKTFYLETFGCQMNAHDSEKIVGTLLSQGYCQVATVEEAGLVLYNTCSIR